MRYTRKALEKGYLEHPGLHAVLTTCLRFSSSRKPFGQKRPCFPSENRAILGQIVFVWGPAFSHIAEIDPGLRLIFKPFSHRFQKVYTYPPRGNENLVHWTKT